MVEMGEREEEATLNTDKIHVPDNATPNVSHIMSHVVHNRGPMIVFSDADKSGGIS